MVLDVSHASATQAAVLIWARKILAARDFELTTAEEACARLGCSRSRAYSVLEKLEEAARGLARNVGRPRQDPSVPDQTPDRGDYESVLRAARDCLMEHPGAVTGRGARRQYATVYRIFVLEQALPGRPGSRLSTEGFADAVGVPLGTLKGWLATPEACAGERSAAEDPGAEPPPGSPPPGLRPGHPCIATILHEYPLWKGTFTAFCAFLQTQHHIPYGPDLVRSILAAAGLRIPVARKKSGTPWNQDTFRTLFPGFQWVGDGKQVVMAWNGQLHVFNLEGITDPGSDAVVAFRITDTEDEAAVLAAYLEGVATGKVPPLAFTLDNRPSNHTDTVQAAVTPATLLPSTPGAPTSKAPIEGLFGLFEQSLPPLEVEGVTERELARSALQLIVTSWARGRNHRPRTRLGGRTPAQAHLGSAPTPEQIQEAQDYIRELQRRQEIVRRTLAARADPIRRQILQENLARLGIPDSEDRLAIQLATYSQEAILQGLAIFRARRDRDTLPRDADPGRYLGGIIRNIHQELESLSIADHLLELRMRARDLTLAVLEHEAERLRGGSTATELPQRCTEQALQAEPLVDFRFWLTQARDALGGLHPRIALAIYRALVPRIAAAHDLDRDRRRDLLAALSVAASYAAA